LSGDIVPSTETTPPGGTGLLSTAATFDATVGSHWDHGERPLGYYMDFRGKAPTPEWPPAWMAADPETLEVAAVQWALGAWERYVSGEGDRWRDAAITAAEDIIARQVPTGAYEGAWLQWRPMPHTYPIDPPWASGIAQGEAASLLARLRQETGEERYGEAALKALRPMRVPVADGGLLVELDNGLPFFEEYPTVPPSMVLNGAIFALWGFRDVAVLMRDEEAERWWRDGLKGLLSVLERYDTGSWSRYDLYPHPMVNIGSGAYHSIHIKQLEVIEALTSDPVVTRVRSNFQRYEASRAKRALAFARKVAFRLVLPRNRWLARSPMTGRARRRVGNKPLVVLCYHAVSEDWRSELTVSPEQVEEQVTRMLKAGYRPSTLTEAVLKPREQKTFVVTFDDAYASVGRLARPILERLGVPATVYVPTAFAGSGEPMSWPGIDHWADGPDASELLPLGWDELAELSAAGWEIGSHTRTHPRLTEIGDDRELNAQLLESRLELERRLGIPCRSIAYPYGDYDRRVGMAAADAGYAAGVTLPPGPWDETRFGLSRVGVYGIDTPRRFRLKVCRPLRWFRGTRAAGRLAHISQVGAIGPYELPS
jgi:peptidoglycan/xylan/chitin deacetylase (PgdA/CDA1 family)